MCTGEIFSGIDLAIWGTKLFTDCAYVCFCVPCMSCLVLAIVGPKLVVIGICQFCVGAFIACGYVILGIVPPRLLFIACVAVNLSICTMRCVSGWFCSASSENCLRISCEYGCCSWLANCC